MTMVYIFSMICYVFKMSRHMTIT